MLAARTPARAQRTERAFTRKKRDLLALDFAAQARDARTRSRRQSSQQIALELDDLHQLAPDKRKAS